MEAHAEEAINASLIIAWMDTAVIPNAPAPANPAIVPIQRLIMGYAQMSNQEKTPATTAPTKALAAVTTMGHAMALGLA